MEIKVDKLVYSKRKSIMLKIDSQGRLIVYAPVHTSKRKIQEILENSKDWIVRTRRKMLEKIKNSSRKFVEGEKFLFLGKEYPLRIVKAQEEAIKFADGFWLDERFLSIAEILFRAWYRAQAEAILIPRIQELAKKHGFKVKKVKITSAKRTFGSCSSQGRINLSWRLVMFPKEVIDYVIIHELAHLQEHNHSKKFWCIVESMLPDYKIYRKWLKENAYMAGIVS